MAQKVTGIIKLQIPAGKATPAPPVGPALGQHGVNTVSYTHLNPAVLADTLWKNAPSHVTSSVSFMRMVPLTMSAALTVMTTLACICLLYTSKGGSQFGR